MEKSYSERAWFGKGKAFFKKNLKFRAPKIDPGFSRAKKYEVCSSNRNLSGSPANLALHFSYDLILYFLSPLCITRLA